MMNSGSAMFSMTLSKNLDSLRTSSSDALRTSERDRSEVLKASEEEVRKLSRFLESVIENIAEPLFIMDGTLRYVYVNDAFSTLTGCEKDEIIGRGDGELHWEEQAELLTDFKRRVFDGAEPVDMPEVNFCDLEGAIHVTRTVMAPMRNAEGDVEYLVGVINDVTEPVSY